MEVGVVNVWNSILNLYGQVSYRQDSQFDFYSNWSCLSQINPFHVSSREVVSPWNYHVFCIFILPQNAYGILFCVNRLFDQSNRLRIFHALRQFNVQRSNIVQYYLWSIRCWCFEEWESKVPSWTKNGRPYWSLARSLSWHIFGSWISSPIAIHRSLGIISVFDMCLLRAISSVCFFWAWCRNWPWQWPSYTWLIMTSKSTIVKWKISV